MNPRTRRKLPLSSFLALLALAAPPLRAAEAAAAAPSSTVPAPATTVYAEVVALDQPFMFNRLGAAQPQGMIFALKRDVVSNNPADPSLQPGAVMLRQDKRARPIVLRVNAGQFLEIRFTNLLAQAPTNPPTNSNANPPTESLQPTTRSAGVHIAGLELVSPGGGAPGINSDATWVGQNPNVKDTGSLAMPGQTITYKYYAKAEGTFMIYSAGADWNGQLQAGLFGAATVEPAHAEWYRSQVTHEDLVLSAHVAKPGASADRMSVEARPDFTLIRKPAAGPSDEGDIWSLTELESDRQTVHKTDVVIHDGHIFTTDGRPLIDYNAVYPKGHPRAGLPILRMTRRLADGRDELIDSDLTALITGPGGGAFPFTENGPDFYANPTYPNRREPFRELTIMYHESFGTVQAFQQFYTPQLSNVLGAGTDNFAINYGSAGIGAEVLASRLGVGPMGGKESVDLKFEEFFLSSWACGDPAMVVDVPANAPNQTVATPAAGSKQIDTPLVSTVAEYGSPSTQVSATFQPLSGQKATKAFYPDDPSNVYHSYMRDHVTMRLLHTGGGITHIHHLHAHQWLRSPNSDDSHYLDSQMIAPGSTYTLEIAHNGGGNRNETVGDSIFHCHFYPHFAGGMWALWRVHDVFEAGTVLDKDGRPAPGWNRTLPDGEITAGTPIPALVPMPTLAMAPAPAPVRLIDGGKRVEVKPVSEHHGEPEYENPGFPFFVPGVSGHRATHPPLDFAWEEDAPGKPRLDKDGRKILLDGGLPRHQVLDGKVVREFHTRWDFSKDFIAYDKAGKPIAGGLVAFELPNDGTAVEKAAMAAHATRTHPSFLPNGDPGNFTLNGLPPVPGAPFANPSVDENGNGEVNTRRYQGAAVQTDVVLTKQGWHFPQQRLLTLWQDVAPTISGERAPQPLFFRANTGETIEFWHTNLVPDYYDLDDFQVRTPTDIIGQHIHLVKFDVTASDGAGNGFNYEDGTFSPDEVRGRIDAINLSGGIHDFDRHTQFAGRKQHKLEAKPAPAVFGEAPAGQDWRGAQTTIQRWDTDPVENNLGEDRTLRTVFTHDHFGPSTHQQVGLYGGLLVEPQGSKWYDPVSGGLLYDTKTRQDGGPTTWQANIVTANPADSYREFALEFADFQLAYTSASPSKPGKPTAPLFTTVFPTLKPGRVSPEVRSLFASNGVTLSPDAKLAYDEKKSEWLLTSSTAPGVHDDYRLLPPPASSSPTQGTLQAFPVNPPHSWSSPNYAINPPPPDTNNLNSGAPYPTLISTFGGVPPGTFSLNYRAEPVPPRTWNPATGQPASGQAGDLAYAYASITRADPALNIQPKPGTPINPADPQGFKFPANITPTLNGPSSATANALVQPTDPFTPVLRAYAGDKVQVRTLVGAHHDAHFFSMDGVKWLYEPGSANTGFRNNQPMGISEHYEMLFDLPAATAATPKPFADYLYNPSAGSDGITNGVWGIMRAYQQKVDKLVPLPNNIPPAKPAVAAIQPPPGATIRRFHVVATTAQQALGGPLVLNSRTATPPTTPPLTAPSNINLPDALLYVRAEDLTSPDASGKLKPGVPVEPLILRAAAGEWIELTLTNAFDPTQAAFTTADTALTPFAPPPPPPPVIPTPLPLVTLKASTLVGLNPQVVGYDITQANGVNVGFNPTVTVAPGQTSAPIYWYAGTLAWEKGVLKATPVELGGICLNPADPLVQHTLGLVGGLVIEPAGSTWTEDANMRAAATVTKADGGTFRDFALVFSDDLPLLPFVQSFSPPANITTRAINYRTEPMAYYRFPGLVSQTPDVTQATANSLVGADPQTPIFTAVAGSEVRFRMLHPSSGQGIDGETLTIDGHVFQEEPYTDDSHVIGHNPLSQNFGTRGGHGARDRFEVVLPSAGGEHKTPGDYLYRSLVTLIGGGDFAAGTWGIFRVSPAPGTPPVVTEKALVTAVVPPTAKPAVPPPADSPVARRYLNRGKSLPTRGDAPTPAPVPTKP